MPATSSSSKAKVNAWAGRNVLSPIINPHFAIVFSRSRLSQVLYNIYIYKPISGKVGELMLAFPTLASTGLNLRNSELHLIQDDSGPVCITVSPSVPSNSWMFLRYLLFALFFHLRAKGTMVTVQRRALGGPFGRRAVVKAGCGETCFQPIPNLGCLAVSLKAVHPGLTQSQMKTISTGNWW